MSAQVYMLANGGEKTIEKVIQDENLNYLHVILPTGEVLPEHNTNAPVYMTVVRGTLTIGFDGEAACDYPVGTVLKIAYDSRMMVKNLNAAPLELIIVKTPTPAV